MPSPSQDRLDPLTPEETDVLVRDMLSTHLPGSLVEAIVERSEGNPLFGEELVRALRDRAARPGERGWEAATQADVLELPRSIHGVIASRIDALTDEQKSFVQDAAVVGREFWLGAVERLSGRDRETALAVVRQLDAKDIVVARPSETFADESRSCCGGSSSRRRRSRWWRAITGAEALVREGLELARRSGHTEQIAWMQGNLADYLVDMGRLVEADEPARSGREAARAVGEVPRIAYSLLMNAYLRVLRLDLDEAAALLDELRALLAQTAESYHEGWADLIETHLARARGDAARAIDVLVAGARRVEDRLEPWAGQLLLLQCIRSRVGAGRRDEALAFRPALERLTRVGAAASAFLSWVDGLLERDPTAARDSLARAADALHGFERATEHGRCLIDLAVAQRRLGEDATDTLATARNVLEATGAALFLADVEAAERASVSDV